MARPPFVDPTQPFDTPMTFARKVRVHPLTARNWCRRHIGVKVGGRWRIPIEAADLIRKGTPLDQVAARVRA